MDATRFTEAKTGRLSRITLQNGPDWAFIPDPLPPNWEFPAKLWPVLAEAREELVRLDEKGRSMLNPSLLLSPLQKREAVRSSSLEGTYATAQELLLYELNPREPTSPDDRANSWREVFNYNQSLIYGFEKLNDNSTGGLPFVMRLVNDMHRQLLADVRGNDRRAGEVRTRYVHVGSDRRYIPPPPGEHLDKCLQDLERFMNEHGDRYQPLVLSYMVHYQLEAIHPFLDGNGRVGRTLLSLTTWKWCGLFRPWLYMSAYFERYKDEYVDKMFGVSTHGDWDRWIEFCLRGTIEQCRDAIRRCDRLNALRLKMHADLDKIPRMGPIVEKLFFHPIFTATQVAEWGETTLPTARRAIERLIDSGYAIYLSGGKPRYYFVPAIYGAAYSESDGDDEEGDDAGEQGSLLL